MKNKNKYINAYVGTALVGGLLVSGGIMASSYRFFRKMMDVNYDRDDLYTINNVPYDYSWIKDYQNEDVYINSFDNLKLHGLKIYAKQKTSNWVILVHGYKSLNMMMIDRALEFIKKGFNVLLIDQRCCGLSAGRYITYGWLEHYDLLDWINYIVDIDSESKIVLYGFSMGASTILNATGEYLVDNVKCVVSDSGFTSMKDQIKFVNKKKNKLNNSVLLSSLKLIVKNKCGFDINDASCLKQLQQSVTPTLFIHGEEDLNAPYEMVFENYYACNATKELLTIANANHFQTTDNPHYYDRIFTFINRFI